MPALGKEPVLTHFVRGLRGCSKPFLARASDGELYVVKYANAGLGGNLLFNESMGTEAYRACQLPVPAWKPLRLTEEFLAQTPELTGHAEGAPPQAAAGICFGSRFSTDEGAHFLEILPGTSFSRVWNVNDFWKAWLVDVCAGHTDNRQAIFRQSESGQLYAVFLDHGHMLGGPRGELTPVLQASRYLDGRIYPHLSSQLRKKLQRSASNLDTDRLWLRVHELPDEWKTGSALSRFTGFLTKLSSERFLTSVLDAMSEWQQRASGYRIHDGQGKRQPARSVLCPGVQVA